MHNSHPHYLSLALRVLWYRIFQCFFLFTIGVLLFVDWGSCDELTEDTHLNKSASKLFTRKPLLALIFIRNPCLKPLSL
jgi:hypothetical protein